MVYAAAYTGPQRDSAAVFRVAMVRSELETSIAASFRTAAFVHSATPRERILSWGFEPPPAQLRIRDSERVRWHLPGLRGWHRNRVRRRGLTAAHHAHKQEAIEVRVGDLDPWPRRPGV